MSELFITVAVLVCFVCGIFVGIAWHKIFGGTTLHWHDGYETGQRVLTRELAEAEALKERKP